jgi:hypothetical protein
LVNGTTVTSNSATTVSTSYTMADLKTLLGYLDSDSGAYIKAKIIANNGYGASAKSDFNALTAIIQGDPAAYDGSTITSTVTTTSITISWPEITDQSKYGQSPVTGWAVGYRVNGTSPPAYTMMDELTSATPRT